MKSARLAGVALYCLGIAFLSASVAIITSGPFWAKTFLYLPAWAGILLTLDGLNAAVSDRSLLVSTPARFLGLYALSVPFWLLFELLNFRLGNWSYHGLPEAAPLRWAGYALAFGTVLPALAEMRQILETLLPLQRLPAPTFRLTEGMLASMRTAGILFLLLALVWPGIFFPLVWGGLFLLLEPWVVRRAPIASGLFELSLGRAEALLSWMGAGMACGVLWEAGNWWAGGRWVYDIPLPAGPRVFEMPLAGYLGFAPFALGAASAVGLAGWTWGRLGVRGRAAAVFVLAAFSGAMFLAIDSLTVRSFVALP